MVVVVEFDLIGGYYFIVSLDFICDGDKVVMGVVGFYEVLVDFFFFVVI